MVIYLCASSSVQFQNNFFPVFFIYFGFQNHNLHFTSLITFASTECQFLTTAMQFKNNKLYIFCSVYTSNTPCIFKLFFFFTFFLVLFKRLRFLPVKARRDSATRLWPVILLQSHYSSKSHPVAGNILSNTIEQLRMV